MNSENLTPEYKQFLTENNRKINRVLNNVLWVNVLAGPLIALCIKLGVFMAVPYTGCFVMTIWIACIAIFHTFLIHSSPDSKWSKYLVLFGMELMLIFMRTFHMGLVMTFFLIPLTSLLYCERPIYLISSIFSYFGMLLGTGMSSEYWASYDYTESAFSWFFSFGISYTIEYIVMFFAGLMLNYLITWHMENTFRDKMEISAKEKEVLTDKMTTLWNKMYMPTAFINYAVKREMISSLIVIDLDNFKHINDTYGHSEGDRALIEFSKVLLNVFRKIENAVVCRFGGDEFTVFLPGVDDRNTLTKILISLKKELREAFRDDEHFCSITMSNGAVIMDSINETYDSLFEKADNSVLLVKHHGKNGYHIYSPGDEDLIGKTDHKA